MNILKCLTPKQKELISILYNNDGLTQKELSALIGNSPLSTFNIIQKILRYEPPLIAKEIIGKYRFYTLSDYGKKCYEDLLKEEVVVDEAEYSYCLQNNKNVEFNDDLKRILIANIINGVSSDSNDILLLGLKNLSIDIIMATFSMTEFLFLCLLLGIISTPMSPMDASTLLLPDAENEAKVLFAKTTYGKLKNLIASELLSKREEEIFGFLDSENLTR